MGKDKKHKDYKPEKREKYEELPVSRPPSLKLVLKVGGSPVPECSEPRAETPPAPAPAIAPLRLNMAAISVAETQHKERKHKKKKKKEKEKHKHKKERRQQEGQEYDPELSPGGADTETGRESRLSSGTEEARSQADTLSSPEPCRSVVSPPPAGQPAAGDADPPPQPTEETEPTETETETEQTETETKTKGETAAAAQDGEVPPLQRFLEHLLRSLQEKDTRGFFSVPVTDDVAPGYSSIIDTPMDFSTIAQRVRDGHYAGLASFKEDFRLMCCNAMTYNRMDTIYYRTAKRLLHSGSKIMSSDKVIELRSVLPYMAALTPEVLGVEAADLADQEEEPQQQRERRAQQEPADDMEGDSDVSAQPAELAVKAETPSPPEVKVEVPPAEVKSEPEVAEEDSAEVEVLEEPMVVDPTPTPSAAAVRQTRRQTRGGGETPQEVSEARPGRQTRGGERSDPETEQTESRPARQTRGAEKPEPEPTESRPGRQKRGADRLEPEPEVAESRPGRQRRGTEKSESEPPEKPEAERPTRQTRGSERPEPEPTESRPARQTRGSERIEPEPEPETRQTRQGRLLEPKPEPKTEPAESRQTRQVRGQEPSKPDGDGRQTRQARVAEPQARVAEPQARATEPQARATEPQEPEPEGRQTRQARVAEPQARVAEPQARVAEPQARVAEPKARVAEPEARVAEPKLRAAEPQVPVVDLEEVPDQPETRQTRRGAAAESQKAADSDPSPPPGPAGSDELEPMDVSEAMEPTASTLIMKQPHLILEKIDAEPGMKLRRGSSRLSRPPSNEEPTAAPPTAPQSTEQQQQQGEQTRTKKTAADTARPHSSQKPPPSGKLGFLRQRVDGTTSLAIVAGGGGGERHERVATVGGLTGRIQQGVPHLPTFRDDKRNQAKPVKPLYYGAYSSFAPSYDSTFATVSHAESGLLFETLAAGQGGQQLATSVRQAADDCDIAIDMVDGLLDVLTDGQHRRLEQRRRAADLAMAAASSPAPAAAPAAAPVPAAAAAAAATATVAAPAAAATVDFSSLRSLGDLGIDVGFLDGFEAEERRLRETQTRLDQTSELLSSLNTAQLQRLSLPPEAGLPPPTQQELQLAEEVTSGLAELVKHVQPGEVAPRSAVRKAMGVGLLPAGQTRSVGRGSGLARPAGRRVMAGETPTAGQAPVVRPAAAAAAVTPSRPPAAAASAAPPAHPSLRTLLSRH